MRGPAEKSPFWGITTYFNPRGYRSRIDNYRLFREGCLRQGLPLVTVELTPVGATVQLTQGRDAEVLIQRQSKVVLWHKERLLNLALRALPAHCRYVCWLDADILFEDDGWIGDSIELLERYAVLQPFKNVIRLPRGKTPADYPGNRIGWRIRKGRENGTYTPSFCARYSGKKRRLDGHTGYAWCTSRSLLERHGFYDRCIIGGGDREMAMSFVLPSSDVPACQLRIRARKLRDHVSRWRDAVYSDVRGNIGCAEGTIHHLWHGESKDRCYHERHELLSEHDYDPERHIELDEADCWRWRPEAAPLAHAVAGYLCSRKEDG